VLAVDAAHARMRETGWVSDHIADLEADFLAHFGIEDMLDVPGPRFLRLAMRTVAFRGVMRARAQALVDAEQQEHEPTPQAHAPAPVPAPAPGRSDVREVPGTAAALSVDPVFSSLIEV
jgi:hypothetical protein